MTTKLNELVAQHESIVKAAINDNRDLSAAEIEACNDLEIQASGERKKLEVLAMVNKKGLLDHLEPAKPKAVFSGTKSHAFASNQDAYNAGQWLRACFTGNQSAMQHCRDQGIIKNAMTTFSNPAGGFLVPEPLEAAVIELREQYGVFRRESQFVQMSDGVMILPKLAGEVTAYWVGETAEITKSDPALQQVRLEAKKLAVLTTMSSELSEDSVISIADLLARSVAHQFAVQEDSCGFLGDGTSTYGGMVGLSGALAAGSKVTATARQTFGALTAADFEGCVGKAKRFGSDQKWYISRNGWANSMQRLLDAVGGATMMELADGASMMFMGFPVVFSETLESRLTGTTGATACYFGDLKAGTYLGERRGVTIAIDGSRYFENDVLALRATERFDIAIHDRGDATNSGGIVALIFG